MTNRRRDPLYEQAIAIDKKALGEEHPGYATDLNNLAALYYHQEKYARAEELFQQALKIREKKLGPDHPHTQTIRNNLSMCREKQGT